MNIEQLLNKARKRIAVTEEELVEAKRRRQLVAAALKKEFGGRIYFNGSVAHGDANDPLTDFDLGVVIPDPDGRYGPNGKGPGELQERARSALHDALIEEFPNLRIEVAGRKRSILVRFSASVSDRLDDLTGDVIVALDRSEPGLWIPRYDGWDASHPEMHTKLILAGIAATMMTLARANRLLKHWSGRHDDPMCSWHIKVLALDAIGEHMPLIDALEAFFEHADKELGNGDTPDPANVGPAIAPRVDHEHARSRLQTALGEVRAAKQAERDNQPARAQAHLANVLPDIVDQPTAQAIADEDRQAELKRLRAATNLTGVGAGAGLALPNTRAWGCG